MHELFVCVRGTIAWSTEHTYRARAFQTDPAARDMYVRCLGDAEETLPHQYPTLDDICIILWRV